MGRSWTQLIKMIARQERLASYPCNIMTGIVESIFPFQIRIGQKKLLDEDFFLLTARIEKMIQRGMIKKGMVVLLIQAEGGQTYAVLDFIRNGGGSDAS